MEDLESQVAKIQLGNAKITSSYVSIVAEQAGGSPAELYVVAELPLLNPAAIPECEKICLSLAGALKRSYRGTPNENTFENAIAQINEELGKLAEMGQTHWIAKLNSIVAVKNGDELSIATCGKTSAYLFRGGEFTDITTNTTPSHPLKTFDNIATGKLKLGDITIFSTTQLFNHIAIGRFQTILEQNNFLTATQLVIEILKDNAGPEIAFACVLTMQVPPGETSNEEIDLEEYTTAAPKGENFFNKSVDYIKSAFILDKVKRIPQISLPKVSLQDQLKNISSNTKNFASKSRRLLGVIQRNVNARRQDLNPQKFKQFSKEKKFFFASAVVLLITLFVSIGISSHYKKTKQTQVVTTDNLQQIKSLINNAQSSLLYKDDSSAENYIHEALAKIPSANAIPVAQKDDYAKASIQIETIEKTIAKELTPTVKNMGNIGMADTLIKLPQYLAMQAKSNIVSYDKNTGLTQDGVMQSTQPIVNAAAIDATQAVIYNGKSLEVWDYNKGIFGAEFTDTVGTQKTMPMAWYDTNKRVYTINTAKNQIISYLVGNRALSKPLVANKDALDASKALDMAVDGNIYVLTTNGLLKYQNGKLVDFKLPFLTKPFSGNGKIATLKDFKNIYILDTGNNRIIVMDKKGSLVNTLTSPEFTKLKDFQVDEKNKVIYVLNDSSLLKVIY